ncbi:MAG TPA: type I polyketide synthase, partial [Myxococcales bacterium]|nr:type I polyketide synthase [Myxococcales bacterium]
RNAECDLALAGGVSVILAPETNVILSRAGMMARDGRCKTFDASADGYVRGEGCGMVVLRRLSDAVRDGNRVLAVIRGTAVNQDGRSNGLTAPNGLAQQRVIRLALADAGLSPGEIDYVEAHGTGTPLGDPIELGALGEALARGRGKDRPLWVGSVKTNVGHLEASAGVAGMIKAALSLQRGRIPRHLHFARPTPGFQWSEVALDVPREGMPWPETGHPRRAGVSSFGFSGTNAHLVLEQAPEAPAAPAGARAPANLLLLSAKSEGALKAQAVNFARALEPLAAVDLEDVCYTAAVGRAHFERRLAVVGADARELREALVAFVAGDPSSPAVSGVAPVDGQPQVVLVFPGQGGQWAGMGRWLLDHSPAFRGALEACDAAISREAGWSLLEVLRGADTEARLQQIDVCQPALFAVGVGLAAHWRSWGVVPDAVVGHSMGEVAAAHVAGALSLADAVRVACTRSRLLRRISGQGEMAVVSLTMGEAEQALSGLEKQISIAASNSLKTTVLSGDPRALGVLLGRLEARGVFCRRVNVDVASHSPQVEPLQAELISALSGLSPGPTRVAMFSTVTGQLVEGGALDAGYWWRNLRAPVRFAPVAGDLISRGRAFFVEMSAHPTLVHDLSGLLRDAGAEGVAVGSLRRSAGEWPALLESLGALHTRGLQVGWEKVLPPRRRVVLPTTPFQRARHWLAAPSKEKRRRPVDRTAHPWLSPGLPLSLEPPSRVWSVALGTESFPWLDGHRVQGVALLSGSSFAEIALAAGREALGQVPLEIRELKLEQPLEVAGREVPLQLLGTHVGAGVMKFRISSQVASATPSKPDRWIVHAEGELRRADREAGPRPELDVEAVSARLGPEAPGKTLYEALAARGLELGDAFRGLEWIRGGPREALGRVSLPASVLAGRFVVHPALLDACFQVVAAAGAGSQASWMLAEIDQLRLVGPLSGPLMCHARLLGDAHGGAPRVSAELTVAGADSGTVGLVARLVLQRTSPSGEDDWFLALEWERSEALFEEPDSKRWLVLGDGGHLG